MDPQQRIRNVKDPCHLSLRCKISRMQSHFFQWMRDHPRNTCYAPSITRSRAITRSAATLTLLSKHSWRLDQLLPATAALWPAMPDSHSTRETLTALLPASAVTLRQARPEKPGTFPVHEDQRWPR